MYLTRMELNTKNRDTMHLLSSPEKIHGLVESAFQGERKRNLWRIERLRGKMYLLILSPDQPDLKDGVERYGFPQYPEAVGNSLPPASPVEKEGFQQNCFLRPE